LKLNKHEVLSSSAFNSNLRRYVLQIHFDLKLIMKLSMIVFFMVGWCRLNPAEPWVESAFVS